jgi:hypothetical protein
LKGSRQGVVFWKAIAAYDSRDGYVSELYGLSDRALVAERAGHLFEIAKVCDRKYRWVNFSIWSSAVGILLSVVLVVAGVLQAS